VILTHDSEAENKKKNKKTPRIRPGALPMGRADGYLLRFPLPEGGALMVSPQEPRAAVQLEWPTAPRLCPALPPGLCQDPVTLWANI